MSPPPCTGTRRVATLEELVDRDRDHDCGGFGGSRVCVKVDALADLPTRYGWFRIVAFWNNRDGKDHVAMVHGEVMGVDDAPTRIHSECLTGDVMGSLRCNCRDRIRVAARIPYVMPPNDHNRFSLETKAARSGHYIDSFGTQHLPEQGEPVIVEAQV
jgi:hypothetical protein